MTAAAAKEEPVFAGGWFPDAESFPDIKGGVRSVETELATQMVHLGLGFPLHYGMSPKAAISRFSRDLSVVIAQAKGGQPITIAQAVATIADRVQNALAHLDEQAARRVTAPAGSPAAAAAARAASLAAASADALATEVAASTGEVGGGVHTLPRAAAAGGAGARAATPPVSVEAPARGGSPPRGAVSASAAPAAKASAASAGVGAGVHAHTPSRRRLEDALSAE